MNLAWPCKRHSLAIKPRITDLQTDGLTESSKPWPIVPKPGFSSEVTTWVHMYCATSASLLGTWVWPGNGTTSDRTPAHETVISPFKPNGVSHSSPMDQSISVLRIVSGMFLFDWNFKTTFCVQTVDTLIRRCVLRRLIWICNVFLCATKRTLGLYGL